VVKKLLLLACLWVPLSGCVPIAVVAGATVGGSILYDKRSFKVMSQDNHATMHATKAIRNSKSLKGKAHVKVSVFNGIGLAVGEAGSQKVRHQIGRILATTPNVRRVYNEITIAGDNSTLSRVNDAWLASKVRTNLLVEPGLNSTNIKIVSEAGTVYLMGVVSRRQATLAANAARKISGVKKVVKVFEYD
jgi:osmotically-inducible protein OsmY